MLPAGKAHHLLQVETTFFVGSNKNSCVSDQCDYTQARRFLPCGDTEMC